ncbi:hypothetical protein [Caballeronia insecticola]|uniref:Uncharacterized protein n=1 Tax=Caballeronia insecticola TaxID=758793 RepID=R4WX71_9BURK|nr:hypothetical protein [Caballeronia insecticola]BAN25720.1 hypothetical protein BRPE64_BCDS10590 [Caballeronia insecticola]
MQKIERTELNSAALAGGATKGQIGITIAVTGVPTESSSSSTSNTVIIKS